MAVGVSCATQPEPPLTAARKLAAAVCPYSPLAREDKQPQHDPGFTPGNPPNCELELSGTLAEAVYCTSRRQMSFDPASHPVEPKEAVLPATHNRLRRLLTL
jgi:hypothetical protein